MLHWSIYLIKAWIVCLYTMWMKSTFAESALSMRDQYSRILWVTLFLMYIIFINMFQMFCIVLHVCVKNQTIYVSINDKNWAFTSPSINIILPRKSYQNKDRNSLERFYCKLRWFSTITCLQPSSFLNTYISWKLITLRL